MIRQLFVLVIAGVVFAAPARAQEVSISPDCDYAACALRVKGADLVAGTAGEKVAGYGFFSAPDVRPWMAVSDSAVHYIEILEANHVSGMVLGAIGVAGVFFAANVGDTSQNDGARIGVAMGGLAVMIWGGIRVRRGRDALNSAVWWYNREFAGLGQAGPSF